MKVVAVSTATPVPAYPNASPVADVLPEFDYSSWYGLLGPAGMKAAEVNSVAAAVKATMSAEPLRRHLSAEGLEPVGSTGPEFAAFLQQEIDRWRKVVAATGTKIQ